MNDIFDNPLALAGLSIMGGKDLGTALTEAATLKNQNDYKQALTTLYQAKAQEALTQARMREKILNEYYGGGTATPAAPTTGAMPPGFSGGTGGAPGGGVPSENGSYIDSPAGKAAQRDIIMGSLADIPGVTEIGKAKLEALKDSPENIAKTTSAKAAAEAEGKYKGGEAERQKGREQLNTVVGDLADLYTQLHNTGGTVETGGGFLKNTENYIASTGAGQMVGKMAGTKNQSIRNQIAAKVPLISAAIKNATGMSAQQMNSNFELQQYLKALSSPTNDYQSNIKILNDISKLYGTGGGGGNASPAAPDSGVVDYMEYFK